MTKAPEVTLAQLDSVRSRLDGEVESLQEDINAGMRERAEMVTQIGRLEIELQR